MSKNTKLYYRKRKKNDIHLNTPTENLDSKLNDNQPIDFNLDPDKSYIKKRRVNLFFSNYLCVLFCYETLVYALFHLYKLTYNESFFYNISLIITVFVLSFLVYLYFKVEKEFRSLELKQYIPLFLISKTHPEIDQYLQKVFLQNRTLTVYEYKQIKNHVTQKENCDNKKIFNFSFG